MEWDVERESERVKTEGKREKRKRKERGRDDSVFVRRDNWAFSSTLPMTGVTFSFGTYTSCCVCVCARAWFPSLLNIHKTHTPALTFYSLVTNGQETKMEERTASHTHTYTNLCLLYLRGPDLTWKLQETVPRKQLATSTSITQREQDQ